MATKPAEMAMRALFMDEHYCERTGYEQPFFGGENWSISGQRQEMGGAVQ
jgi:hypothetical protein